MSGGPGPGASGAPNLSPPSVAADLSVVQQELIKVPAVTRCSVVFGPFLMFNQHFLKVLLLPVLRLCSCLSFKAKGFRHITRLLLLRSHHPIKNRPTSPSEGAEQLLGPVQGSASSCFITRPLPSHYFRQNLKYLPAVVTVLISATRGRCLRLVLPLRRRTLETQNGRLNLVGLFAVEADSRSANARASRRLPSDHTFPDFTSVAFSNLTLPPAFTAAPCRAETPGGKNRRSHDRRLSWSRTSLINSNKLSLLFFWSLYRQNICSTDAPLSLIVVATVRSYS